MSKLLVLLAALPLAAQVHIGSCVSGDTQFTPIPTTNCPTGNCCYTSTITLPAGAPQYLRQERYGNFTYTILVADGQYSVVLHFIENSTAIIGTGQRVFNVTINGVAALTNFDLAATAPLNTPIDRSFQTLAVGGAGITIAFATVTRNAVVSAIDVIPVPVAPFPGCASDGANGIKCTGGITGNTNVVGTLMLGTFGLAWSGTSAPVVLMLSPTGDGTGKYLSDGGVVACPANLPADILALNPACHQFVWASGAFATAQSGDKVIVQLAATPCTNPAGCAGIRTVQMADGSMYYLVDVTGNK